MFITKKHNQNATILSKYGTRKNLYSKIMLLPIGLIVLGINTLQKWIHGKVKMTIKDGERLDEIIMIHFIINVKRLFSKLKVGTRPPLKPSTLSLLWTPEQDTLLCQLTNVYTSPKNRWKHISQNFVDKTSRQCAMRWEEIQPIQSLDQDHKTLVHYTKSREIERQKLSTDSSLKKNNNINEKKKFGEILKRTFRKLHYHAQTEVIQSRIDLIKDLIKNIPNEYVLEFLKGGHAIVHDNGATYVKVVTTEGSHPRISSHYPQFKNAPHYGITLSLAPLPTIHLLTGIIRREQKNVTWVQLESSPMPSLLRLFSHEGIVQNMKGILSHLKDYLAHTSTKKQYGPLGASWFSEKGKKSMVIHIR